MSLLLHIDTAVDAASVCISRNDEVVALAHNAQPRESAAWLQPAIRRLMQEHDLRMDQLEAVSVSAGPGSYTGLRVGMATAKGLCYALKIPLIAINTLEQMTTAALPQVAEPDALLCPMIDARRMEVFTAIYNRVYQPLLSPTNLVVQEGSFDQWLASNIFYIFGNGSDKVKHLMESENVRHISNVTTAETLVPIAFQRFVGCRFDDLAYTEPFYVKDFYTT